MRLLRLRKPKAPAIPPAPFPDTHIGRKLYAAYAQEDHVQLGLPHVVRYLNPDDVVSIRYDNKHANKVLETHVPEECCLLITQNNAFPYYISDVRLYYLGSMHGLMNVIGIESITVNAEFLALPVIAG